MTRTPFSEPKRLAAATCKALAEQSDWELAHDDQLVEQQDADTACDYLTGVIENRIHGIPVVIGRAHCKDGRSFDIARNDPFDAVRRRS